MGCDRICTHAHPYNPKSTGIPGPLLSLSLGSSSMQNPADTPWGSMAKPSSARGVPSMDSKRVLTQGGGRLTMDQTLHPEPGRTLSQDPFLARHAQVGDGHRDKVAHSCFASVLSTT